MREIKTNRIVRADGKSVYADTVMPSIQARMATALIPSLIASDSVMKAVRDDEGAPISPNRIASLACDFAAAVYREYDRRGWLIDVPDEPL